LFLFLSDNYYKEIKIKLKIKFMTKQLKGAIIACVALLAFFIGVNKFIIQKDNKYPVTYFQEVKHDGYEASEAGWKVDISPKLALEKAKEQPSHIIMKVAGYLCLGIAIVLILLAAADKIAIFDGGFNNRLYILFALLVGFCGFEYGAYGAILQNNYISLSTQDFTKITNVSDTTVKYIHDNETKDLEKLFDEKPIIR
jgi:hypothetical protein